MDPLRLSVLSLRYSSMPRSDAMRRSPLLAALLVPGLTVIAIACTPAGREAESPPQLPEPKKIAFEGEPCTPSGLPRCAGELRCKELPYAKPVVDGSAPHSPSDPSDVGGSCGGVAGFHCAEGLACVMPTDQVMVADGMGSCALRGVCTR